MVRSTLIEKVARETKLTKKDAERIITTIFHAIKEALVRGDKVELRGLGSFGVKQRAPRLARNLKTLEVISLPPRQVPFFRPGKALKVL